MSRNRPEDNASPVARILAGLQRASVEGAYVKRPVMCAGALLGRDPMGRQKRQPCDRPAATEERVEHIGRDDDWREIVDRRVVQLGLCESCGILEADFRAGLAKRAEQPETSAPARMARVEGGHR